MSISYIIVMSPFLLIIFSIIFFFNDTATTEIYTLSLHDALPISGEVIAWRPGATPHISSRHAQDRKSTRLNSSHSQISYAVFCLKKKKIIYENTRCRKEGRGIESLIVGVWRE